MQREIITTSDGSSTIYLPELNEHYHSKHGAIAEAQHVFLKMGLDHYRRLHPNQSEIKILEIGLGTGLNALLTYFYSKDKNTNIYYTGLEAYPVCVEELQKLNYFERIPGINSQESKTIFDSLHKSNWEVATAITPCFTLVKKQISFLEFTPKTTHDIIYFDAFGPRVQPELWTDDLLNTMYNSLNKNGVFVTYCAKGSVRRTLVSLGFEVERLEGPPGKREMLRATKK